MPRVLQHEHSLAHQGDSQAEVDPDDDRQEQFPTAPGEDPPRSIPRQQIGGVANIDERPPSRPMAKTANVAGMLPVSTRTSARSLGR